MQKRWFPGRVMFLVGLAGALAGAGCGSISKLGSGSAAVTSSFGGHWSGPWSDSSGHQGTLDVVVGTDGKLTGTVVDTTAGLTGSITGAANNTGSLTLTETYPSGPTVTMTGTVSISANGHMAGAVQTSVPGQPGGSGSFDLVKQ